MAYLKHEPTGDIYPYNSDMALRDDMVEYTPEPAAAPEPAPKAKAKAKAKAKPAPKPVEAEPEFDFDELPMLDDD